MAYKLSIRVFARFLQGLIFIILATQMSVPQASEANYKSNLDLPHKTWVMRPLPAVGEGPCPTGCKHMRAVFNSANARIYFLGGDYQGKFGPNSGRNELWSYSISTGEWRLEYPYCGPPGDIQPAGPDEVGWAYDSQRNLFWMLPGFMYGSQRQSLCQGKAEVVGGEIMSFDPVAMKWKRGPEFISSIHGIKGVKFAQYDPVSDRILRFYWHGGSGVGLISYDPETGVQSHVPLPVNANGQYINNSRLNQEYTALDVKNRHLYVVSPLDGKLFRMDIDNNKFEQLSQVPHLSEIGRSQLVWDSVNSVLYWLYLKNLDGYLTLYIYHPDTGRWEKDRMYQPDNLAIRGNASVFDPVNNALLVIGGLHKGNLDNSLKHFFLYRYGDPSPNSSTTQSGRVSSSADIVNEENDRKIQLASDNHWQLVEPEITERAMPIFPDGKSVTGDHGVSVRHTKYPIFREYTSPVYGGGRIFYFGGGHGGYPGNDIEIYDIRTNRWKQYGIPHAAPKGDPVYGSGGSPNVYINSQTGEWQPYTIHGYTRTSYDASLDRFLCTATFCRQTFFDHNKDAWTCKEKDFGLISYDDRNSKWEWLLGRKDQEVEKRWPKAYNLTQWDENLGGLLAFGNRDIWLIRNNKVSHLYQSAVELSRPGIAGTPSLFIPDLKAHLLARLPQGGKPDSALFLFFPEEPRLIEIPVPGKVRNLIGNNGNFYMAYDRQHKIVLILQAYKGGARVWGYDVVADASSHSESNWYPINIKGDVTGLNAEGAVIRSPFHYDPVNELFWLLVQKGRHWSQGIEMWAFQYQPTIADELAE